MAFDADSRHFLEALEQAFFDYDPAAADKGAEADNVRRIRRAYAGILGGNIQDFVDLLHDDIVGQIHGPASGPICGKWEGKQNFLEAIGRNFSLFDEQNPRIEGVVAQGDLVVVLARETGRFLPTGKTYDLHWVQYFHFKDGKIAHFREYMDGEHPWG